MFDLEQAIGEWRKQMIATGIQSPVPLEELESHLREEIERQIKSDINAQRAFENAVEKIGQGKSLESEFQKANPLTIERITSVVMGIFIVIIGLRFGSALVAQTRGWEKPPDKEVIGMYILAFILLVALVASGLILAFYGGKNPSWLPNKRKA